MNVCRILLFFPLATLLGACVSTSPKAPNLSQALRDTTGQDGRACVRTSDIRGYGTREGKVINIDARQNYYIATMRPGCFDLGTSMAAMFSGDFNEVCGGRVDKVTTAENVCTIDQMFEFVDREAAFSAYDDAVKEREKARNEQ